MSDIRLEDVEIQQQDEHPVTESVKLNGPPGTGKTTTLAARVAVLLRDHDYTINDVAWVTYRRSLAKDVLQRLASWGIIDESALKNKSAGSTRHIGTIHAIANRSSAIGRDVATVWDKKEFCTDRLGINFWGGERWEEAAGESLFRVFDWLSNNRYDPGVDGAGSNCPFFSEFQQKFPGGDLTQAWAMWCEYKDENNLIDFHQMLSAPLRQNTWPTDGILVIDEYHDVTALMARVCEHWMARAETVMVAADPNQVVNAYDGASPRFYNRIGYPEIHLDTTYRVPENHWDVATRILDQSDEHDPPPVKRVKDGGAVIKHRARPFDRDETLGWMIPEGESTPPQIVSNHVGDGQSVLFLARTRLQCDGIARAFERAGIMYHTHSKLDGWNVYDTNAQKARNRLYDALSVLEGFHPEHIVDGNSGGMSQHSLNSYQDTPDDPPRDPDTTKLSPGAFADLLEYTNADYLAETRSTVEDDINSIRYGTKHWLPLRDLQEHVTDEFWGVYTNGARSVSSLNKGAMEDRQRESITQALSRYGNGHRLTDIGDVEILTIHAAKGYEADVVVVYDGITRSTLEGVQTSKRTRENEFRTWFVALSRAKSDLHIIENGFEWTSPFIGKYL